jgi:hypothetical protein
MTATIFSLWGAAASAESRSTRIGSGIISAIPGWTRGGAEGDLMELNGWTSPQMLRRYGASARRTGTPQL